MKRTSRILFLISLPETEEFRRCSEMVSVTLRMLREMGVEVREAISGESMADMGEYELAVVMAHSDERGEALILADGEMAVEDFIGLIPEGFRGILDFSSCNSVNSAERIKERCPACHVMAAMTRTALAVRLMMYMEVVKRIRKGEEGEYREICGRVLKDIAEMKRAQAGRSRKGRGATHLGDIRSSIYAPKAVRREDPYIIQIILHGKDETGEVMLVAQNVQEGAAEMGGGMRLKPKRGDRIKVEINFSGRGSGKIEVEGERVQTVVWDNRVKHIRYCVTVGRGFEGEGFVTGIKIEVSGEPAGECVFRTKVENERNELPAAMTIREYDREGEQRREREEMVRMLRKRVEDLNELIEQQSNEMLEREKEICVMCLELIVSYEAESRDAKRVFISSTSDLKEFRDIAKEVVESKGLVADMYEEWGHRQITPRDECCRRVLDSDMVLCILGSRYGYVDDGWGLSMTEIEYRIAKLAGKKILVFIMRPPKESDEEPEKRQRQQELIERVGKSRILREFKDEKVFEETARRDLGD